MRVAMLVLIGISCRGAIAEGLPLLKRMTEVGIAITADQKFVVPPPSFSTSQDAATRKQVLDDLAGGRGWKNFSRDSVSAPVAIDVNYIKDAGGARVGHQVHSAFVVFASLDTLKNQELMEKLFGKPDESEESEDFEAQQLKAEDLRTFGIDSVGENEAYVAIQMPLLNRVIVRGIIHTERQVTDDSVTLAWELDPRFCSDASGRNTWATIERDDLGKKHESDKRPYRGAGGYMVVSRLSELEGACLVESRIVLHEPEEWFRGSNVLRSKLPILMQESARSFRRKLMNR